MRILASLLLLICSLATMLASAGAPPFTNGSPLVSGVDGSYQATARGKNLLGVFRFTYSNGVQTSSPRLPTGNSVPNLLTDPYNDYVFFVEGKVFRGLVQANINISSIAGVLDNGASNVFNAGASVSPTPTATPTTNISTQPTFVDFMSGFFRGSMDENSPFAFFSGRGEVVINIETEGFENVPNGTLLASSQNIKFKFSGVRARTGTSTSSTTTTTTSGSTTSG